MYNQIHRTNTSATPATPGGTRYFNHFPSNFLRPYGLAGSAPDHNTLQRRINPVCCEWLKRPHIAMSEFAATIVDNFNWLANTPNDFIATNVLKERRDSHEQFLQALSNLNTKNPEAIPLPQHL